MNENLYVEEVTERFCGVVIASKIRPATPEDIEKAKALHKLGECPHNVVKDDHGWLYDIRYCAICGEGLGTV